MKAKKRQIIKKLQNVRQIKVIYISQKMKQLDHNRIITQEPIYNNQNNIWIKKLNSHIDEQTTEHYFFIKWKEKYMIL